MPHYYLDVDAAVTVHVNYMPLIDDTDFKAREESVTYNQAGLDLLWNFVTTAGVITQTAVTPTDTGGVYDWTAVGNGIYKIEIPASAGGTINNDAEGFGWFSGFATGILPWVGPVVGFRAALLNALLVDNAFSATRGLSGTALPDAVADAAGGLVISDAGGLDVDAQDVNVDDIETANAAILALVQDGGGLDLLIDAIKAITDQFVFTVPNLVNSNALAISGSTTAADNAEEAFEAVELGTVVTAGTTTENIVTDLSETTDDHYKGRLITFRFGALAKQTLEIKGYNGTTKALTVSAATEAPANPDTFIIH